MSDAEFTPIWTAADLRDLRVRGVAPAEVERQIELFRGSTRFARLERPCTVGDGIRRLEEREIAGLHALHAEAAAERRFCKFVPASGAATRMFRELLVFRDVARATAWEEITRRAEDGETAASTLVTFLEQLTRFPFDEALRRQLAGDGLDLEDLVRQRRFGTILEALLGGDGLNLAALPKGLLPFHATAGGTARTPFEEQLVEAADYVRDADGRCRLHFTVSPEHRASFESLFDRCGEELGRRLGARFEVGYSVQNPATDTLAVDAVNRPVRTDEGALVFRPGGHGALIENLADLSADLVYVKNIDNVQPDASRQATLQWKRSLGGYLVQLERRSHELLRRLREESADPDLLTRAARFTTSRLQVELNGRLDGSDPAARRRWLIDRLSRPLRVCGVVPNTGEPGGGPFWIRDADGMVTNQIVETAQIDSGDAGQIEILSRATHFNPVDLVCAVRDVYGRPFDLQKFVDPSAAIVTTKSVEGREVKVLERPGLWNGAMAGWNTVFVEVPLATFSPVKSVMDLLRPEHQAR